MSKEGIRNENGNSNIQLELQLTASVITLLAQETHNFFDGINRHRFVYLYVIRYYQASQLLLASSSFLRDALLHLEGISSALDGALSVGGMANNIGFFANIDSIVKNFIEGVDVQSTYFGLGFYAISALYYSALSMYLAVKLWNGDDVDLSKDRKCRLWLAGERTLNYIQWAALNTMSFTLPIIADAIVHNSFQAASILKGVAPWLVVCGFGADLLRGVIFDSFKLKKALQSDNETLPHSKVTFTACFKRLDQL